MFGNWRRQSRDAPGDAAATRISADLRGAVIDGPVAIGDGIVQIHAEHGAVVNYVEAPRRPVPRPRDAPVRSLPRDFPQLLGRERELSLALAETKAGASVELVGPPGIGKTSLLRRLAHRVGDESPDAVLFAWCGAQPVEDLQQLIFEGLYACDVPFVPTPAVLASHLQGARAVVLLDEVRLERTELERLLDTLPAGAFVCACAERRMWGESRAIVLPGLHPDDAVALVERELGHRLDAAERVAARRLATQLDGHPLALLQAAADPRTWTSASDPPPPGSPLLDLLAALPGVPIPTSDIAAVAGTSAADRDLRTLEARHLVQAHSPRYSLLGAPPSAAHADAELWRRRLFEHFAGAGSDPGHMAQRTERAAAVAAPVLALLAWAEGASRPADVLALVRATDGLLALGGRWGAWGVALERALRAARSLGDEAGEAWVLHQLGSRALCLGDAAAATAALTSALATRERLGDVDGASFTRHNLAVLGGGGGAPPGGRRGPRAPLLTSVLALLVLAAGVALAVALSGSDGSKHRAATVTSPTRPPTTQTDQRVGATPPPAPNPPPETTPPTATAPPPTPLQVSIFSPSEGSRIPAAGAANPTRVRAYCAAVALSASVTGGQGARTYDWTVAESDGGAPQGAQRRAPTVTTCTTREVSRFDVTLEVKDATGAQDATSYFTLYAGAGPTTIPDTTTTPDTTPTP